MAETEAKGASEQTRARLLEAAREVFSQQGFQAATVREICRRAEANVAAVSYHFGNKEGLLAEALNFTQLATLQQTNRQANECSKIRLRLFTHEFLLMLLDEQSASRQCRIMARELADPTPALDKIVREAIAPLHQFLGTLVREIVGEKVSEADLMRCVYSILGQCSFYYHSRPVLQRLRPELRYDADEIKAIAEHITDFSLAALERLAKK
jgi:AcrR family transcriptional regulator